MRTLRVLVDLILPATDSPAASAADTHYFIDLAIPACAKPPAQKDLPRRPEGILGHRALAQRRSRWPISRRVRRRTCALPYDQSFFKILKDYTLTGYFLSEIGATQALAYEQDSRGFPGRPAAASLTRRRGQSDGCL